MKHKYHDVIVAWAEGKEIEVKHIAGMDWSIYRNINIQSPDFNNSTLLWRVKPEKKVMWYKIFRFPSPKGLPFIIIAYNESQMKTEDFIRVGLESLSGWIIFEYE